MAVTYELIVKVLLAGLYLYTGLGLLFAVAFSWRGATRLDEQARGASVWFRLVIMPGAIAFWPLLLGRWMRPD